MRQHQTGKTVKKKIPKLLLKQSNGKKSLCECTRIGIWQFSPTLNTFSFIRRCLRREYQTLSWRCATLTNAECFEQKIQGGNVKYEIGMKLPFKNLFKWGKLKAKNLFSWPTGYIYFNLLWLLGSCLANHCFVIRLYISRMEMASLHHNSAMWIQSKESAELSVAVQQQIIRLCYSSRMCYVKTIAV